MGRIFNKLKGFTSSMFAHHASEAIGPSVVKTSGRHPTSVTHDMLMDSFITSVKRLSTRSKQILMLDMYADENLFLERFIDFIVNPIVGKDGIQFVVNNEEAPKTHDVFNLFSDFNEFSDPQRQAEFFRDAILTGELCFIRIQNSRKHTKQLLQVHAPTIQQTIVDPGNYNRIAAVEIEQESGKTALLRVIDDDDRFTPAGLQVRQACAYDCYLFQLRKRTHPTLSPFGGGDLLRKYEIRGEPFLMQSSKILYALVEYLWTSINKAEHWNRYNYIFKVSGIQGVDEEEVAKKIRVWRDEIGEPKPGSALWLPDTVDAAPMTFPMQSNDLSTLYNMFRNSAAWHATTRETNMGEGDVRYASNQGVGVSEPTIEMKEILQSYCIGFLTRIYDSIGNWAVDTKQIPVSELKSSNPNKFQYTITSNEISKRAQEVAAKAARDVVETGVKMKENGIATNESINASISQKTGEILGVEFEPNEGEPQGIENILKLVPPVDEEVKSTEKEAA